MNRLFGLTTILLICAYHISSAQVLTKSRASLHGIHIDRAAPDFFSGALLGNGALGAVVTTRPDAIVIYLGHNKVWDVRIAEENKEKIGTFQQVFDKVKQIPADLANLTDDPWYKAYNAMTAENYSKPYPRPFPTGSIVLGFDRRKMKLLGHDLDIATGMCTVSFLDSNSKPTYLKIFTDMENDQLWISYVNTQGKSIPHNFERLRILPDPSTPSEFPKYTMVENLKDGILSFRQVLPKKISDTSIKSPKDKAFSVDLKVLGSISKKTHLNWNGNQEDMAKLEVAIDNRDSFLACVSLKEGLDTEVPISPDSKEVIWIEKDKVWNKNLLVWKKFWNQSSVTLSDSFLESIWYRNLYFLNCSLKDGVTTPGIFANWSYNNIGTAWHGDYHMNYNTQQPFWVTFSSNHLDKNLPYVDLIEALFPVSKQWAKDYYQLPGMYIPHSAYPVEMSMNPYPIPDWGWEISETPWAIQGLWWHYTYSMDVDFLRDRAYTPIKAAVEFLVAYMQRAEGRDLERWGDNKYHIFPSVPPELYGLRPGFQFNHDINADLTLTKFAFHAFKQATEILGTQQQEKDLLHSMEDILKNFPDYPTAKLPNQEKVFVAVDGEDAQTVYNVPLPLFSVFPGEEHGLHSDDSTKRILFNTYANQRNEGGNDLVFIHMQAARIGKLDLEDFKRQVRYCLLPNGTATDMVMQTGGRYSDQSDYAYMSRMGIWFENFALPAVINECLIQGYNGSIVLFPNWNIKNDAAFEQLRTVGAFLVSAKLENGKVRNIKVHSEKGQKLELLLPGQDAYKVRSSIGRTLGWMKGKIQVNTQKDEVLVFDLK
ncbi:glycosyl hydrolase family 95 catalytic domain-containing protein [Sphingobacterium sp. Mn56C]|uniref:glycosyl hydrolase family 95 catalytic domain-containing protein n=1 Tax=Sphingobacterium sp. Mn56C TaxID=3395261 RepID=UPI003BCEE7E5